MMHMFVFVTPLKFGTSEDSTSFRGATRIDIHHKHKEQVKHNSLHKPVKLQVKSLHYSN